jgi:hemerythrin-like domain-containing protein
MLRDPALIPLSHQHQHALALCVRIIRAGDNDAVLLQREVARLFEQEIRFHFDAEERVLFPAAERLPRLRQLVDELRRDHVGLRAAASEACRMTPPEMRDFAERLSAHIRREERELFEGMQQGMSSEELAGLGAAVDADFRASRMPGASCGLGD